MTLAAVTLLILGAAVAADIRTDASMPVANPEEEEPTESPEGDPNELTSVAEDRVVDLGEHTESGQSSGVAVEIAYPEVANAEPLTERLGEVTRTAVNDFILANPGARRITIDWNLTVAEGDIMGVRLTTEEVGVRLTMAETGSTRPGDDEEPRTGYETVWYDAADGRVAGSTELLRDHDALVELAELVREDLADQEEVDTGSILPVARLFDSIGFNPAGDLVVEFDHGRVAPADSGRVFSVIARDDAQSLLSDLGERALTAATVLTRPFEITEPPPESPAGTDPTDIPGVISPIDDDVDCAAPETRCVALTFDDGPGGGTDRLLDTLAEYDAKATFFLTGEPTREHLPLVRREYAEGHELANHTMTHPNLSELSVQGIIDETEPLQAIIRRETGYTPTLMRPPYGATNGTVQSTMADAGMAEIMWSVDTLDWKDRKPDVVTSRTVDGAADGAIILFHDIHDTTIQAIPSILDRLEGQGYTYVTVSQLLGDIEPGESYWDAYPEEEEDEGEEKGEGKETEPDDTASPSPS